MYRCDHCSTSRPCPFCDFSVEQDVQPCPLPSALWVRVSQRGGPALKGVKVVVTELSAQNTVQNGFAVFDPAPPKNHEVALDLSANGFDKKYKPVGAKWENLGTGQTGLVSFELDPLANPRLDPARLLLFVKGKAKPLKLLTDREYEGTGQLTGADPGKLVEVPQAQKVGAEVALQAKEEPSTWEGIPLTWELDVVPGKPASAHVCVVKATMEPRWPLDEEPIERLTLLDPGVVVALKTMSNDKPPRARVRLVVEPKEFDGKLQLKSKAGKVKFFAKAEGLDEVAEVQGPFTQDKEFFVEGSTVSGKKLDEEVQLLAEGDVLDRFVVTVVQAELVIHEDVVRGLGPLSDSYKVIPGKARVLHPDPKHKLVRAKLLIKKLPWDAPCDLQLAKEGAGSVEVFREKGGLPLRSLELRHQDEVALALPSTHKANSGAVEPSADFVGDKPVCLWLHGLDIGEAKLSIGIPRVQKKLDTVTLTLRKPKLRVEVTRKFKQPLPTPGDIAVKLKVMKTGSDVNGFPKLAAVDTFKEAEVEVDDYLLSILPEAIGEKPARVLRTEPAGDDASIAVVKDMVVKFELLPKYTKVQFIAYWVYTGQSKGIDARKTTHQERVDEARIDMKAKAALMKAAIQKITSDRSGDIEGSDTLKIFMAPEFTFRGAQGAYPIDVVSEVFDELKDEIDKGIYDDWLFVAGTGVGTVTSVDAVADHQKVKATTRRVSKQANPDPGRMPFVQRYSYWLDYENANRPAEGWAMLEPHAGSVAVLGKTLPPNSVDWVKVDHLYNVVQAEGTQTIPVTFVNPPAVEIANVALLRKGGTKVPSGGDGRGLRQALINKEYVAWADLPSSVDLYSESFFFDGRQLVTLYGTVCRAKPPKDSTMEGNYQSPWTWKNTPPKKTEKSPSGIGGGSAFTIDQIRFGLEICMDHNFARLASSIPVDEKPHVQLIPSGGASINKNSVWTVDDGLVFNVDMAHHKAEKGGGNISPKGLPIDLTQDASAHYDTSMACGNGQVVLYTAADIAY